MKFISGVLFTCAFMKSVNLLLFCLIALNCGKLYVNSKMFSAQPYPHEHEFLVSWFLFNRIDFSFVFKIYVQDCNCHSGITAV